MREDALARVLLVKAVEETDGAGGILPLADREQASRDVLRATEGATTATLSPDARSSRVLRLLDERATRLCGPLIARHPVLGEVLDRSRIPAWATALVLALAFATGAGLASLDGSRRINILAFPFLGVVAWNLVVYALLAMHALRGWRAPASLPAVTRQGFTAKAVARRIGALAARTSRIDVKLGEVVARYSADWLTAGGPLLAAHARRLLHLGAAVLAVGMIAGLYFRGVVFRYEAGWESTFLGPRAVRAILGLVFGPASTLSGIVLPQTDAAVEALRWTENGGGGSAAPWIHLVAVTLAIYVVGPRLVLALLATVDGWRWRRAGALPGALIGYARSTLGAAHAGHGSGRVLALPYACDVPEAARPGFTRWATSEFGRGAGVDWRAMTPYGSEVELRASLADGSVDAAEGAVLLVSLAATPEAENHGLAITAVRDAARGAHPPREARVLVDESAYAARMAGDASLERRLEERRALWREFVRGYGLDARFVDLRPA